MKIISIHIDGFGKLENVDLTFDQNLEVICEKNGYGKTTIAQFIKAMFYGLGSSQRKNTNTLTERTKYTPLSGTYGGTLAFECEKGKFVIRRVFKTSPTTDEFYLYDGVSNTISYAYSANIGEEILGVGKDTFEQTAFFKQKDLKSIISDDIRASLSGGNLLGDDMDAYTNAIEKLKLRRREVSRELKNLTIEQDEYAISIVEGKIKDIESELNATKNKINEIKKEQSELESAYLSAKEKKDSVDKLINKKKAIELVIEEKQSSLDKLYDQKTQLSLTPNVTTPKRSGNGGVVALFVLAAILVGVLCAINLKTVKIVCGILAGILILLASGVYFYKKRKEQNNLNAVREKKSIEEEKLDAIISISEAEVNRKLAEYKEVETEIKELTQGAGEEFYEQFKRLSAVFDPQKLSILENDLKHQNMALLEREKENTERVDKLQEEYQIREKSMHTIEIIDKTMELLTEAKDSISKNYVEPIQRKFDEIYGKFKVADNITITSELDALLKETFKGEGYLSAGLCDLVEVCKRLVLVDLVYKKEKPFLILDDPFVNLDDENIKRAKILVKEISKIYQVVLLTCHKSNCF